MNGPDPDYIADTSAVIRLLRRDRLAEQRLQGKTFATTFVTMAELDLGILKADNPIAAAYRCKEVLEGVQVLHGSSMTPCTTPASTTTWRNAEQGFRSTTSGSRPSPLRLACPFLLATSTSRGSGACR